MKLLFHKGIHATLWLVVTTILCLLPGKDMPEINIVNFDKAAHFLVFGLLCFLWLRFVWQFKLTQQGKKSSVLIVALAIIFYGGFMEVLQGVFYADRTADVFDFIANSLGVITAVVISFMFPVLVKI
ncbi:MAG: VanZ family protein [Flavobacteriales bacterium]